MKAIDILEALDWDVKTLSKLHARGVLTEADVKRRLAIDAQFKKAKFEKTKINAPFADYQGNILFKELEGIAYKGLLIHKDEKCYDITHIASGLRVLNAKKLRDAKVIVFRLAENVDFAKDEKYLYEHIEKIKSLVHVLKDDPYADITPAESYLQ